MDWPKLGQAPCAPRFKYDPGYNDNWVGPDLGTLMCTNSPFLWHTLHFFLLCPVIISSPGKHMAQPSWQHSSSSLSFTNWLDSVVKAARYMHDKWIRLVKMPSLCPRPFNKLKIKLLKLFTCCWVQHKITEQTSALHPLTCPAGAPGHWTDEK